MKPYFTAISFLSIIIGVVLFATLPAVSAEMTDYEVVPCQGPEGNEHWSCMRAFVYDTDPAGTNVRSGPGTDYDIVTTLPSGALVTITGSVGEWMRIDGASILNETDSTELRFTGWVHGTRLSVMVLGESDYNPSPLYAEPDTASPVVARIPIHTYVRVAGCREGWIKVRYRELVGWLGPESRGLTETMFEGPTCLPTRAPETDNPLAASCASEAYVAETDPAGLAVRSAPSDDAPVVKTLPRHTRVYITRSVGEWMGVNTYRTESDCPGGDPIGWTYGHLLAVRTRSFDVSYPIPWWDSSGNVLVFAEPITGSAVATKIPPDTEVVIVGCWGEWLKVRYKGVEGWLSSYCGNPDGECW
ncbi:MAG: SH3 domain-containing protein [Deltaproteobacteria bacterium]|nr:SH3 domain-containing protein [Candidatus Zymogenaceae bacterium]